MRTVGGGFTRSRLSARCAGLTVTQHCRAAATSSSASRALKDDANFGIFQNTHINNFPVRAAIDIGTGGVVSMCIGRVDAQHHALQRVLYQTQLPLYLETATPGSAPAPLHHSDGDGTGAALATSFALSERTLTDIRNKMRVLHGAMRRDNFEGLSERAAVISWPLCLADNAEELASSLTREFKVDVRVLGKTFSLSDSDWLPLCVPADSTRESTLSTGTSRTSDSKRSGAGGGGVPRTTTGGAKDGDTLKMLIARSHRRKRSRGPRIRGPEADVTETVAVTHKSMAASPQVQVQQLAFLAHAAMTQCVAPQRLLVIAEDPQKGLSIVGTDTTAQQDMQDLLDAAGDDSDERQRILEMGAPSSSLSSSSSMPHRTSTNDMDFPVVAAHTPVPGRLLEHRLPLSVSDALRMCVVDVQRRSVDLFDPRTTSPNPLLPREFTALEDALLRGVAAALPEWVRRKSRLGGIICGTSFNGGVLNLAARVAQKSSISLDHLETHAAHHFCGLTDVLLAENFPQSLLVLPSVALAGALLRALDTPRVEYIPELTTAAALLVSPGGLWLRDRQGEVQDRLGRQRFYQSSTHRTFNRPHLRHNPIAAPGATWQREMEWNDVSFSRSMQGT